ncbi:MAG: lamin tail domain-containing protein [Candidatus Moranbacteria bacterium]|nr:lamin tail domain-containing protein [Candidatus Moranbacteria bacterium]MDD3964481.1 lamin tail domain-containing protein [Candidatus Moranbacteria bacterium]
MNIKIFSFCFVILFSFVFYSDTNFVSASTNAIILSEIQITGGTGHTDDEFVELYNPNSTSINISGYRLRYKNSAGKEGSIKVIGEDICMPAYGYYLWANGDGVFADISDTTTKTGLSSKYSLALFLPSGAEDSLIDSVSWENDYAFDTSAYKFTTSPTTNESMVRDITTNDWLSNFSLVPTPTKSTSTLCPEPDPIPKSTYDSTIRLNEFLANPSEKEEEMEFIELYNSSDTIGDISLWSLRDSSASGKYIFPEGTTLPAQGFLVIYRPTFEFALNNSNETVSLLDPNGETRDTVFYKTAKEDISYNNTSAGWRGGTPTPGMANHTNSLPETREKVPKKGYRGVTLDFDARGRDTEHDHLKYTWNFGDGHKSYKETTTHKYEENGTYIITLKVNDGKDDILETFTLEIISLPHPEVRIVALLPNPAGNDTGNEWLLIENREKKKINLKGYSIATGWKNLVNHPLREDFFIKPKKQAFLRNPTALFTLPNQKGKIELRAPDGKVLQDIKYKLDKSIADDVVYRKEKGSKWKWDTSSVHVTAPSPSKEQNEKEKNPPLIDEPMIIPEMIVPLREEMLPEEIIKEKETTSPLISLDPDRPLPQDILTYGTTLETPHSLILAVPADEKIAVLPLSDSSSVTSEETPLLIRINATLNDFLNTEN